MSHPISEAAKEIYNENFLDQEEIAAIIRKHLQGKAGDKVRLAFKRLDPRAVLPTRAYRSAGFDLACLDSFRLCRGLTVAVDTGIAVAIPDGHVGLIWDRSSLGSKGVTVYAGCIDQDYRGPVKVVLHNSSLEAKHFYPGDRIAQLLVVPIPELEAVEVDELPSTERGERGFGSSGQ